MSKPYVLFVDDEPNILHGLKRFTRPKRAEWNLLFANGGEEACEIIQALNIDVLVTDMRMPGMDGAQLMQHVSEASPGTIRIILSGEADIKQAYRTIGRSHRFLAKPCDPAMLVSIIEQILLRREQAGQEMSLDAGSFFDRLAVRHDSFTALRLELEKEDAEPEAIAAIVSQDTNLAARVLQIVNSAYFGRPVETCSIFRAVEILGLDRMRDLLNEDRFGQSNSPGPSDSASSDSTCTPYELGKLTRDRIAASGGTKDEQDMVFILGLFCSLGHVGQPPVEPLPKRNCFADKSAVYALALLGLPPALIDHMYALTRSRPDVLSKDNCATAICETVSAAPKKVA